MADMTSNQYVPDYLVPPGEILEEYLEGYSMTQTELADRTGLTKKTINEIIKLAKLGWLPKQKDKVAQLTEVLRKFIQSWDGRSLAPIETFLILPLTCLHGQQPGIIGTRSDTLFCLPVMKQHYRSADSKEDWMPFFSYSRVGF
jgi:transcriptional regulator with XRE-family HTH domain